MSTSAKGLKAAQKFVTLLDELAQLRAKKDADAKEWALKIARKQTEIGDHKHAVATGQDGLFD